MVGWHHQLIGHESGQTPGDREGQGSLTGCPEVGMMGKGNDCSWQTDLRLLCGDKKNFKYIIVLIVQHGDYTEKSPNYRP